MADFEAIEAASAAALERVMRDMADDIRQSISTPYPPASRPGQPPHRRTGRLQNGVTHGVDRFVDGQPIGWVKVDGAFYWKYLEYGTRKMAARPFLGPMKRKWGPIARRALDEAVAQAGG